MECLHITNQQILLEHIFGLQIMNKLQTEAGI